MATKNIQMNLYNGSDYDVLYPQTTAAQASAVPTTRTVNGKALSSNITLSATDVSALPISGGTLTGDLTIKSSNNFGTKINLGDGDYVHLSEPEDDCLEIKAKKVNIVTSDTSSTALTHNGSAIGGGGISTPVSIANGGTGSSTASSAVYNLLNGLSTRSASQVNSYNSSTYLGGYYGSTGYKIPISSLLTYIQNNASGSGGTNGDFVYIGSYIGTGNYGETNINSISFTKEIKAIIMIGNTVNITSPMIYNVFAKNTPVMINNILSTNFVNHTGFSGNEPSGESSFGKKSSDGKTFYWYNIRNAGGQFNINNAIYYYLIIY